MKYSVFFIVLAMPFHLYGIELNSLYFDFSPSTRSLSDWSTSNELSDTDTNIITIAATLDLSKEIGTDKNKVDAQLIGIKYTNESFETTETTRNTDINTYSVDMIFTKTRQSGAISHWLVGYHYMKYNYIPTISTSVSARGFYMGIGIVTPLIGTSFWWNGTAKYFAGESSDSYITGPELSTDFILALDKDHNITTRIGYKYRRYGLSENSDSEKFIDEVHGPYATLVLSF